jgi:hypothetical protein
MKYPDFWKFNHTFNVRIKKEFKGKFKLMSLFRKNSQLPTSYSRVLILIYDENDNLVKTIVNKDSSMIRLDQWMLEEHLIDSFPEPAPPLNLDPLVTNIVRPYMYFVCKKGMWNNRWKANYLYHRYKKQKRIPKRKRDIFKVSKEEMKEYMWELI